jgi:Transposase
MKFPIRKHLRRCLDRKSAKTVEARIDTIVAYDRYRISNALSEPINGKIEKVKRMVWDFRNRFGYRIAISFYCVGLDLFLKSLSIQPLPSETLDTICWGYP